MKHLRLTFEDEEFKRMQEAKQRASLSWHDLILTLSETYISSPHGYIWTCSTCNARFNPEAKHCTLIFTERITSNQFMDEDETILECPFCGSECPSNATEITKF